MSIFFWKENENPYGIFCQWYNSPFVDKNNNKFANAEQYMMFRKAKLFKDEETAQEILKTSLPKDVKLLGRKVRNFDEEKWNKIKYKIVKDGNLLKFKSNKFLRDSLLSTKEMQLIEASPYDKIWGIGFNKYDAEKNKDSWGENLLGKALMEVREFLRQEIVQ